MRGARDEGGASIALRLLRPLLSRLSCSLLRQPSCRRLWLRVRGKQLVARSDRPLGPELDALLRKTIACGRRRRGPASSAAATAAATAHPPSPTHSPATDSDSDLTSNQISIPSQFGAPVGSPRDDFSRPLAHCSSPSRNPAPSAMAASHRRAAGTPARLSSCRARSPARSG